MKPRGMRQGDALACYRRVLHHRYQKAHYGCDKDDVKSSQEGVDTLSGTVLVVILLLIALAVLGRTVPAWHDAMINFFTALSFIFTGSGSVTTG
jgi:hypothetical protein